MSNAEILNPNRMRSFHFRPIVNGRSFPDGLYINYKKVVLVVGAVELWTTSIILARIPLFSWEKRGLDSVDNSKKECGQVRGQFVDKKESCV